MFSDLDDDEALKMALAASTQQAGGATPITGPGLQGNCRIFAWHTVYLVILARWKFWLY